MSIVLYLIRIHMFGLTLTIEIFGLYFHMSSIVSHVFIQSCDIICANITKFFFIFIFISYQGDSDITTI